MQKLTQLKEEGNSFFKDKKYDQAIAKFQQAVSAIEEQSKDYLTKQKQVSKLYVICLVNAAIAGISTKNLGNYDVVVGFCDKALSIDPENVKGLYRRALARKEKAELLEREHGVKYEGLLELYQKAKEDLQKLCLIDKNNDLATKALKTTINDVYRVTVGRGEQINLGLGNKQKSQKQREQKVDKSPYDQPKQRPKRGMDMQKIMKEYKVEQVTTAVQQKVRSQYLSNQLPTLRSQLQKAMRTLQKSQQTYVQFIYRMDQKYLNKVQPTFDMLSQLTEVIIKKGSGDASKAVLSAIYKQKNFKLMWKSYSAKQKQDFKQKWTSVGNNIEELIV